MSNTINLPPETLSNVIKDMIYYRQLRSMVVRSQAKKYNVRYIAKKHGLTVSKVYSLWNAYLAKGRL